MTQKSELGTKGESAGCLFLERKGYKVFGRNVRYPWGELDIVAKSPDETLVFVEVKTMHESLAGARDSGLQPEDHMTGEKMKKFRRTASLYAGFRHDLVNEHAGWRLDVLAITKQNGGFVVRHYENV